MRREKISLKKLRTRQDLPIWAVNELVGKGVQVPRCTTMRPYAETYRCRFLNGGCVRVATSPEITGGQGT